MLEYTQAMHDEGRRLLAEATPGPWESVLWVGPGSPCTPCFVLKLPDDQHVGTSIMREDAALIAHMRTAYEAALDEIERPCGHLMDGRIADWARKELMEYAIQVEVGDRPALDHDGTLLQPAYYCPVCDAQGETRRVAHDKNCSLGLLLLALRQSACDYEAVRRGAIADTAGWLRVRAESRRRLSGKKPTPPVSGTGSGGCDSQGVVRLSPLPPTRESAVLDTTGDIVPLDCPECGCSVPVPYSGWACQSCGDERVKPRRDCCEEPWWARVVSEGQRWRCPTCGVGVEVYVYGDGYAALRELDIHREVAAELEVEADTLERATDLYPMPAYARSYARAGGALNGADAQALEGALRQVERELAAAKAAACERDGECAWCADVRRPDKG